MKARSLLVTPALLGVFGLPLVGGSNAWAQPKPAPSPSIGSQAVTVPTASGTSVEDKVKAEFAPWRYAGARVTASFQRGPVSLLSVATPDSLEQVWKFYSGRIPTDSKLPLAASWDIPGDNTLVGANDNLGSSYALTLNASPREAGTIVYQKGNENVVIEIRARTPEQVKTTGLQTDIRLLKMRPLDAGAQAKVTATSGAGGARSVTSW